MDFPWYSNGCIGIHEMTTPLYHIALAKTYAHILDEDRKINAQKFESAFYTMKNPDLRDVRPPQENSGLDLAALIEQLKKSPELAQTLASLIQGNK